MNYHGWTLRGEAFGEDNEFRESEIKLSYPVKILPFSLPREKTEYPQSQRSTTAAPFTKQAVAVSLLVIPFKAGDES